MTLKSRSFQARAWLRYDSEFRLKLAANGSWHYDVVDTELWASCFAADGLVASQPPPLACYSCGSSAHFYTACPHRRLPSSFRPTARQKPDQANPPATGAPTPLPPQWDHRRSLSSFIMTKGAAFAVNAAPTVTHAPIAEASTPNGAAPASAPNPLPSTLRPLIFARLLQHHPNHQFTAALLTHLTHGFDKCYQGPHRDLRAYNLHSAYEHSEAIDEYLQHEGKYGRIAGPFQEPPFQPFHCSGMGIIPKQDGAWRVITHLSAPDGLSVNDHIDPEAVTLRYATIDDSIRIANQLGAGTLLAKIDLKKSVKTIPS